MSRQESQIMKGVAILLMLFLHLFNQQANVALCTTFLHIGDAPLISYLVRAASPVSFFLILGGYGMYCVWQKGDKHRWSRLWKLMLHYWIVLLAFVSIGCLINSEKYPGGWLKVLENMTAFKTSYNGEMWFLFPYVCLTLLSPWLFKLCERFRVRYILLVFFVISIGTSFIISRYGDQYLYRNMWVYNPFLIVHLSFAFLLGAMAAKCKFFEHQYSKLGFGGGKFEGLWTWSLLILLIALRCVFNTSTIHTLYAFVFIYLFLRAPRWGWLNKVLSELGNKSMAMWMIHSWFCYYLFHDWIYSFRYPIVIMAVLLIISYLSALVVDKIASFIKLK